MPPILLEILFDKLIPNFSGNLFFTLIAETEYKSKYPL